jgi:rhamnosyl/mannosyltransferase
VIPIGIDISNFHYAEPKKPNVLFVGRLRYYKGLEYLIQAMTEVNAELNIVGTGSEEQKLKALTAKLNLSAKIHFLGDIAENELPKYYANCSVFTLPSIFKTEAFGISQLEAMASAKPIVSTSLGTGVDWINQNGTTGFTVPPKKARALSDALNTILSDNTLRQRLGKAARNRTEQYFSKEIMLEKISAIYQQTAF